MIIVVGNEKGGCGKTTIAVNLAAMAARDGRDVLLVDADPRQQSAARWAARRLEFFPSAPRVQCVTLTGRNISAGLEDLAKRYGVVVVDTGAEDSPELRAAALLAQVLVVPVQLDALDLWSLPTMETLFGRAHGLNPGLRAVVVANRVPYQTADSAGGEMQGWMAENVSGLPADNLVVLVGRTAYGRAIGEGLAVVEPTKRDTRAAAEAERLYAAVMA